MSPEAQDLIQQLLSPDPRMRPNAAAVKAHPFFAGIDWEHLRDQPAPFVPRPSDQTDTSYFECEFWGGGRRGRGAGGGGR